MSPVRNRRRKRARSRAIVQRLHLEVLENRAVPSFIAAPSYPAGTNPQAFGVGDFNSDGIPDFVVANNDGIDVLFGNGDGSFEAPRTVAMIHGSTLVVADFNGDGIPDLAVTTHVNSSTDAVTILLGNGDRTFRAPISYNTGPGSTAIVVGDFNGDGVPDLAVGNHGNLMGNNSSVSILLGNGDGTFQAARNFVVPDGLVSIVAGDFNGDGIEDLATANTTFGSTVNIFRGNGDGTFQEAETYTGTGGQLAVADFNGDGNLDIAEGGNGQVFLFLNNGDGTFSFGAGPPVSGTFTLADINGDGNPDFVFPYSYGIAVVLNNGDGTYQPRRDYLSGIDTLGVAVTDLNNDGLLDLAKLNGPPDNSISVLLADGSGNYQAAPSIPIGGVAGVYDPFVSGDFNGDGVPDVAAIDFSAGGISVALGNGDGTFRRGLNVPLSAGLDAMAVGDFNRDGSLDIAVTNYVTHTLTILLGNGDGTFSIAHTYSHTSAARDRIAVADVNGDGIPDIIVANDNNLSGSIDVFLGIGDGSFQSPRNFFAGPYPMGVAAADVNGDGFPDVLVANLSTPGQVNVLLGNGDGTFRPARGFAAGDRPYGIAVGDFNGDGIPDVVVPNETVGNSVSILLGNGDGTFRAPLGSVWATPRTGTCRAISDLSRSARKDYLNFADFFRGHCFEKVAA